MIVEFKVNVLIIVIFFGLKDLYFIRYTNDVCFQYFHDRTDWLWRFWLMRKLEAFVVKGFYKTQREKRF